MRITVKPPSPLPTPSLAPGALIAVRVEAADPAPLLAGPPSITYEGRYTPAPSPAFLFPAPAGDAPGPTTAPPAASDFRTPPTPPLLPYVDIPLSPGDVVTATLTAPAKTYSAAFRAPAAPGPAPVEMALVEGGAAPPPGPPPTPQPAPGLTITPTPDQDVLTLDPAPGNDNIVVKD